MTQEQCRFGVELGFWQPRRAGWVMPTEIAFFEEHALRDLDLAPIQTRPVRKLNT